MHNIHDVVRLTITHSCVHGKFINDVDIMHGIVVAPCVDENTLVIIHANLVLHLKVAVSVTARNFF